MEPHFFLVLFLTNYVLMFGGAMAAHGGQTVEREIDGRFHSRDADHYDESGHNTEFDHEAILGSVKEAEEFGKLSPEEAKQRLEQMLPNIDVNGDQYIDKLELKKWILNSFINLSREEAEERLKEADENRDGVVTWQEYLHDSFGAEAEADVGIDDVGDSGMLLRDEKEMWTLADKNGDGQLDLEEFQVFTSPEEHTHMHSFLVNQTLRDKDDNRDGRIDFHEYLGDRGTQQDKTWVIAEKDKFDHELDTDGDGKLDLAEIHHWIIPDNDEIAVEEVDHLFAAADDDQDGVLSFNEVLEHYDVFVGSEATDGGDFLGEHFDDEL